jgi:predicted 3-demethylubiquinone-9 3-methyltransferase (glyoxalase superfamily)
VEHFWEKLSEGGDERAKQCGWLKDKFGVSWQIVPTVLPQLLGGSDSNGAQRAMQAMLQMNSSRLTPGNRSVCARMVATAAL